MRIFFLLLFLSGFAFSATASPSEFKLAPGEYFLTATYRFAKNGSPIVQTDRVTLLQSEGHLLLKSVQHPEIPIVTEQYGNEFVAHIDDAAGFVKLSGELVADHHVVGQMVGQSEKQGNLSGSFELKRLTE